MGTGHQAILKYTECFSKFNVLQFVTKYEVPGFSMDLAAGQPIVPTGGSRVLVGFVFQGLAGNRQV
jgi:hypothetical protein